MISGSVRCYGTKRNYVHSFMDVFVLDTVDDICKRSKDKMVTGTINDHTVTLKLSELGSKLQEVAKQIRAENEEKQKKTET